MIVWAPLVLLGVRGLPMSTTHVASGAILGGGVDSCALDWRTVRRMALAWGITLPAAAARAATVALTPARVPFPLAGAWW